MKHKLFWKNAVHIKHGKLQGDSVTQYCILGGGVSGLFAAFFLLEQGVKDIVILEKNYIGSGSTGHSAGMLVGEIETCSIAELCRVLGRDDARKYLKEQQDIMRLVVQLIHTHNIDCDFDIEDFVAIGKGKSWSNAAYAEARIRTHLHKESVFIATPHQEIDFKNIDVVEKLEQSISVNPLKFAQNFAVYLQKRGVRIYENTPAISFTSTSIETPHGQVMYSTLIDARGIAQKHRTLVNYLTSICVSQPCDMELLKTLHLNDKDMFITDNDPEHAFYYGKITHDNRLLIGYGDVKSTTRNYDPHVINRHIASIVSFVAKNISKNIHMEYAWTAPYSLSNKVLPLFERKDNHIVIGGAGTQIASIWNARRAVRSLFS